ncbi:flagellar basal body-associated FliL family protein [Roseburia sp. MSJ-14]|uniref:flagellar basal body-associated FliL family protein n=1 Tax=Roseburia sp. MSJ-14 TaxID=2841514 RepID=UPI001C11ADBD|nr:flagellar basal body-associated FliL family protein [Roseburia sp. MSJ-14]MBU5472919.1 flagellar basal body-associated FliL family protein [Roseburia sp. MSJ-14]
MKKNLMSVLILALVLANLILTAILMISVVPQSKKANELITKVCSAIDLELESGKEEGAIDVPMSQIEEVKLSDGEKMTINLKNTDGKDHYVMMSVSLALDTKNKDYTDATVISDKEGIIKDEINKIVSGHTIDDMRNDTKGIQNEILKSLRKMYDSDFIVSVVFSDINYQ